MSTLLGVEDLISSLQIQSIRCVSNRIQFDNNHRIELESQLILDTPFPSTSISQVKSYIFSVWIVNFAEFSTLLVFRTE